MRTGPSVKRLLGAAVAAARDAGVAYAVGGAIAMRGHGYSRATSDVDIFVHHEDADKLKRAMRAVGLAVTPVFAPFHYVAYIPGTRDFDRRIDIMVPAEEPGLTAIDVAECVQLFGDAKVRVFPLPLLVWAKFDTDRPEDKHDVIAMLQRGLFDPVEVHAYMASIDPALAAAFAEFVALVTKPRAPRVRAPGARLDPERLKKERGR